MNKMNSTAAIMSLLGEDDRAVVQVMARLGLDHKISTERMAFLAGAVSRIAVERKLERAGEADDPQMFEVRGGQMMSAFIDGFSIIESALEAATKETKQ